MTPRKVLFIDGVMAAPPPGRGAEQLGSDIARRPDLFAVLDPASPPGSLDRGTVIALGTQTVEVAADVLPRLAQVDGLLPFLRQAGHLVLAGQGEGRELWPQGIRRLHAALAACGLDPARVTLLQQSDSYADEYAAWCAAGGAGRAIGVLVWHHHLNEVAHRFAAGWADPAWRARRLEAVERLRRGDVSHRFACLINKLRAHRIVMLGHIFRQGWDGAGLVSCSGGRTHGDLTGRWGGDTPAEGRFAADIAAFHLVQPRLPLVIEGDQGGNRVFGDQLPIYENVGLAWVAESEMGVTVRRFTEKTLKPLLCGRPVIIAGNPGSLAQLRRLGFQTFDGIIDEGYDAIADPQDRLAAVFDEVDRLLGLPEADWQRAMRDAADRAAENLRVGGEQLVPVLDRALEALGASLADRIEAAA